MPMSDLEEHNDFDQLRNLLEGAEVAPSRDFWPEIESKLDEKTKRPFLLWFAFVGLLLTITLTSGYFYINANEKNITLSIDGLNNADKNFDATVISHSNIDDQETGKSLIADSSYSQLKVNDKIAKLNIENIEGRNSLKETSSKALNNNLNYSRVSSNNKPEGINLKSTNLNSNGIDYQSNINRDKNFSKSDISILNKNERANSNLKVSNQTKSINKNIIIKSLDYKIFDNQIFEGNIEQKNTDLIFKNSNNSKKVTNDKLSKSDENNILNNTQINKINSEIVDFKKIESRSCLLIKSKPFLNESERFEKVEVKAISHKSNIFNAQKSYDIISSVNYFYNNNYRPESNMLINNSYKYGVQVNYYVNKNWGLGLGIVQNTISYNSVLLEQQNETTPITTIIEVKLNDSTYVLTQKDTLLIKSKEVASYKSLQLKSVNIPLQLLFKFNINNRFSLENRVGLVTSFTSSQSKRITKTVGLAYQHNLNLLCRLTPSIQLLFGAEYSFYITDLVQNKSGWYPLGLHLGARINL